MTSIAQFVLDHDTEDAKLRSDLLTAQQALAEAERLLQEEEAAHDNTRTTTAIHIADLAATVADLTARLEACDDPDPVPTLPQHQPLPAQMAHQGFGICQHVNFADNNIHEHQTEIMERYGQMHVAQLRSMYVPNLDHFDEAVAGMRLHSVKWNATVAARKDGVIKPDEAAIRARIAHMAANNADIIGWIEGINEPNEPSDPNWVADVLRVQWVIVDEVSKHPALAHVQILSPSMHDVRLDNSNGAHWKQYANGTITAGGRTWTGKDLCDAAAVHSYPAGSVPGTKRAQRVQWVYDAFGDGFPIKFTEWGYTTALNKTNRIGGHKVTSPEAAAAYICQGVLDFAVHGWEVEVYEFMDDPNGTNNDTEKNFGQHEVESLTGAPDSTWTPKPSVAPLTAMLGWLEDRGEAYIPTPVGYDIPNPPASLAAVPVQKRDGSTRVYLYDTRPVWDAVAEQPISVAPLTVEVIDEAGSRPFTVGAMPVPVDLR